MFNRRPNAGDLRQWCTFERPEDTPDGSGGVTVAWVQAHQCHAMLEPLGQPAEAETAGAAATTMRAVLTVRDLAANRAVDRTWRVAIGGVTWNVRGPYPLAPQSGFLRFQIESGVAT